MENYSYSSYPDSVNSSPRSREIDENASWDEPPSSNYKVKFLWSYGGKIHPRPHDNQLTYVGGDTKILSVDRNIRFSNLISKLSSLCEAEVCFKYQLPGEDLDALISVTNDEDLEHMMLEYDRLYRASAKPARLRLFLFPLNPPAPASTFGSDESSKSERQWFVDALNSVQIQSLDVSPQPAAAAAAGSAATPDFLFGLDKGGQAPVAAKIQDPSPAPAPPVQEMVGKDYHGGSEDRRLIGDPVVSPAEIQRQIQEQAMYNRKIDEVNARVYTGEYYPQKATPLPQVAPVTSQSAFWSDRHITSGPYPAGGVATEQPMYFIQTPAGVYQSPAMRPVAGQVGQPYYGMQRMIPEFYREQGVHNAVQQQSSIQAKMGGPYTSETIAMVRQPAQAEQGFPQVSYDGAGRQLYYTAPGVLLPPASPLHPALSGGGASNQEGKFGGKAS